ncbi:sensor histidine kinase [Vagococcus xieshaowenii]|uniref:histidine kinase n=1 Tax=Vagococcus xieshaowenii TaxID=2562451 RepID=A0AAJ5EDU7_9ENTE|nr:sensor histidine kinase [Vagococcus xieshaowenii]QCA28645.1 sensor histidine kinase [Vagococcus xieshaowenii]TFZ40547.1 sensor histidine kinase [Vagococcus xieshaowenii]
MKKMLNKFYEKSTLQVIISICFTSVAVIFVLFLAIFYQNRMNKESEKSLAYTQLQVVSQVGKHLDSYFHSTMNITNTLYGETINKWDVTSDYDRIKAEFNKQKLLNQDYITSISLFDSKGELVMSTNGNKINANYDVVSQPWFYKAITSVENSHFTRPYVENLFDNQEAEFPWVFSLSQAVIYRDNHLTKQGILLINMDLSRIEQICKNVDLGNSGYLFLMDDKSEIIYHPKEKLISDARYHENLETIIHYPEGTQTETINDDERVVIKKKLGYTGWQLIGISQLPTQLPFYKNQFIWLFCGVSILLLFLINYILSKLVTKPIEQLEQSVEKIENNSGEIDFELNGTSEIRHLSTALNSMTVNLQRLMEESVENEKKKRQSEMAVLQAQINPHFLYNTLDSIVWMIESNKYSEAITMITSLAKLFRISLNKGKDIITLAQEISHVENYLKIQSIRYKDMFRYDINIESNVTEAACIKLIMQPLVENAIYHGIEPAFEECVITISVTKKDNKLSVLIKDDGVGMSEEQVDNLLNGKLPISSKGSSVGFRNVYERLKLCYGEEVEVTIESELEEGTTITINMPIYSVEELERRSQSI